MLRSSLILAPLRLAFACLTIVTLLVAVLLFLSLDRQPLITTHWQPSEDEITRAKRLLDGNDLLRTPSKSDGTLILTKQELNTAAHFLLNQTIGNGEAQVVLSEHASQLTVSVPLPPNPIGAFANARLWLHEDGGVPAIGRLQIGRLSIPSDYTAWLIDRLIAYAPQARFFGLADKRIRTLRIAPGTVLIAYTSNDPPVSRQPAGTANGNDDPLTLYQDKLAEITRQPDLKQRLSLSALLRPLALFARKRSKQHNPIDENRAFILVLNHYINGNLVGRLLPSPMPTAAPAEHTVLLNGRADLARHFIASAALAATGHDALANMIGLFKEISDAKNGSGFSFTDLAADQAGAEFGEMAVKSIADAKKLQQAIGQNASESDYMPATQNLPENLNAADFEQRFGGVDSPEFQHLMTQIEQRIADLPLYGQPMIQQSKNQ